ncbi:MAG TPA: exosome complex protein Rrp42 [Acidobacteriota bacterium]|nr:exosome complex protein Rrp42 [Acidobacteriota bacterium]
MAEDFKNHVLRAIKSNVRFDGRTNDQYRKTTIDYDVSWTAEGSARVSIGNTVILAGVKLSLDKPYPDTPDSGMLMIESNLLPLASPLFESGPPGIDSIELARVIDRGVRESHAIDLDGLCVEKGEKVWFVTVDICTVNVDGNLFDASSLAVMAALQHTVFPSIEDGVIDYKKKTSKKLPLKECPIAVTIWKVGDTLVVDPSQVEESVFESRLTVTSTEDGTIVAMQKGGDAPLTQADVERMVDMAIAKAAELRKTL